MCVKSTDCCNMNFGPVLWFLLWRELIVAIWIWSNIVVSLWESTNSSVWIWWSIIVCFVKCTDTCIMNFIIVSVVSSISSCNMNFVQYYCSMFLNTRAICWLSPVQCPVSAHWNIRTVGCGSVWSKRLFLCPLMQE